MDLRWSPAEEAFRGEARGWLEASVPRGLPSGDTRAGFAAHLEWERALHAARWAVVSYLPRMAAAEDLWCQGWSEPGAGSDLAAVRSSAVRDAAGGGWRLSGQKTWTTRGAFCTHLFGLFRTDPMAERHKGLTYFLVPLDAPGVTVRGFPRLDGDEGFAEVFLDEVFVPDGDVLGAVNQGWQVAMTTAGSERGLTLRSPGRFTASADRLLDLYRERPSPALRDRVVQSWIEAQAYQMFTLQQVTRLADGQPSGLTSGGLVDNGLTRSGLTSEVLPDLMPPDGGSANGPGAVWRKLAALGAVGTLVPEEHGGLGLDENSLVPLLEEVGRSGLPGPAVETIAVAAPLLPRPDILAGDTLVAVRHGDLIPFGQVAEVIVARDGDSLLSFGRNDLDLIPQVTAIQCHGALGYTTEYELHLFAKRAWALAAAWGDPAAHRAVIADSLGVADG